MVRTTDGGQHWAGIPAPRDALATTGMSTGVTEVRYADPSNGWVYGPDLWSTHDGGATWTALRVGGATPFVEDLEASGGMVDLVAASGCDPQTTPTCSVQLWQATVGSDNFQPVPGVTLPSGSVGRGALTLHGRTGYLLAEGQEGAPVPILWRTTDGTHWTQGPSVCANNFGVASVAAIDSQRAAALCAGEPGAGSSSKQLYATSDAGATWVPEGTPAPTGGDGGTLAAADAPTLAIATASGAAEIYRTTDGGATWQTALQLDDGGLGWGDFGFTDASHGLAVHGPVAFAGSGGGLADPATLFLSSDAGVTWDPVVISG
jgi:photosystem II stability/assembly factor-like uncharacterized protein